MSGNSLVQCSVCKRQEVVDFGTCLRSGWPKCHGYTMTLMHTAADIGRAVGETFAAATVRIRVLR